MSERASPMFNALTGAFFAGVLTAATITGINAFEAKTAADQQATAHDVSDVRGEQEAYERASREWENAGRASAITSILGFALAFSNRAAGHIREIEDRILAGSVAVTQFDTQTVLKGLREDVERLRREQNPGDQDGNPTI